MRYAKLWIIAVALGTALFGLWAYFQCRGRKHEANRAMASLIDAWTAPKVHAAQVKLDALKQQIGADQQAVAAAEAEVAGLRRALRVKYRELALTPEEIEARLSNLRV